MIPFHIIFDNVLFPNINHIKPLNKQILWKNCVSCQGEIFIRFGNIAVWKTVEQAWHPGTFESTHKLPLSESFFPDFEIKVSVGNTNFPLKFIIVKRQRQKRQGPAACYSLVGHSAGAGLTTLQIWSLNGPLISGSLGGTRGSLLAARICLTITIYFTIARKELAEH